MNGPKRADPEGLYSLTPFTDQLGGAYPVYTSPQSWENCISRDPMGVCERMFRAIEGALTSARANKPTIEFKAWIPSDSGKKSKRVRLSASLRRMTETEEVWIELKHLPDRSKHGVSRAL
jgi:hypothetical protein